MIVAYYQKRIPIYTFDSWKALKIVRKSSTLDVADVLRLILVNTERKKKKRIKMECILLFIKLLIRIPQPYWKLRSLACFFSWILTNNGTRYNGSSLKYLLLKSRQITYSTKLFSKITCWRPGTLLKVNSSLLEVIAF